EIFALRWYRLWRSAASGNFGGKAMKSNGSGWAAAGLLAGLALGAGPARAQGHESMASPAPAQHAAPTAPARAATPLEAAFDAADMGDLGPLQRMLPAARGDLAVVISGRLAASRLQPAAAPPALARIAAGRDPALRAAALAILTSDAFLRGTWQEAARWGRALGEARRALGDDVRAENSVH